MKKCKTCGEEKLPQEFHKKPDTRDGLQGKCKVCANAYSAAWAKANPGRVQKLRDEAFYGISGKVREEMRTRVRCECCGTPFINGRDRNFDHCHTTGVVRGVICRACNTSYGLLKESSDRIRALLAYHEKHQQVPA